MRSQTLMTVQQGMTRYDSSKHKPNSKDKKKNIFVTSVI